LQTALLILKCLVAKLLAFINKLSRRTFLRGKRKDSSLEKHEKSQILTQKPLSLPPPPSRYFDGRRITLLQLDNETEVLSGLGTLHSLVVGGIIPVISLGPCFASEARREAVRGALTSAYGVHVRLDNTVTTGPNTCSLAFKLSSAFGLTGLTLTMGGAEVLYIEPGAIALGNLSNLFPTDEPPPPGNGASSPLLTAYPNPVAPHLPSLAAALLRPDPDAAARVGRLAHLSPPAPLPELLAALGGAARVRLLAPSGAVLHSGAAATGGPRHVQEQVLAALRALRRAHSPLDAAAAGSPPVPLLVAYSMAPYPWSFFSAGDVSAWDRASDTLLYVWSARARAATHRVAVALQEPGEEGPRADAVLRLLTGFSTGHVPLYQQGSSKIPTLKAFWEEMTWARARCQAAAEEAEARRAGTSPPLREDRYTVTMVGFHRVHYLKKAVSNYRTCPSIEEVVIVWSNPVEDPPPFGDRVRVIPQPGSLNVRLYPIPGLRTRAIIVADDDMEVPCAYVEGAFQAWRRNSHSIVGKEARYHMSSNGELEYQLHT
jgi:hypothetical protein